MWRERETLRTYYHDWESTHIFKNNQQVHGVCFALSLSLSFSGGTRVRHLEDKWQQGPLINLLAKKRAASSVRVVSPILLSFLSLSLFQSSVEKWAARYAFFKSPFFSWTFCVSKSGNFHKKVSRISIWKSFMDELIKILLKVISAYKKVTLLHELV